MCLLSARLSVRLVVRLDVAAVGIWSALWASMLAGSFSVPSPVGDGHTLTQTHTPTHTYVYRQLPHRQRAPMWLSVLVQRCRLLPALSLTFAKSNRNFN